MYYNVLYKLISIYSPGFHNKKITAACFPACGGRNSNLKLNL